MVWLLTLKPRVPLGCRAVILLDAILLVAVHPYSAAHAGVSHSGPAQGQWRYWAMSTAPGMENTSSNQACRRSVEPKLPDFQGHL